MKWTWRTMFLVQTKLVLRRFVSFTFVWLSQMVYDYIWGSTGNNGVNGITQWLFWKTKPIGSLTGPEALKSQFGNCTVVAVIMSIFLLTRGLLSLHRLQLFVKRQECMQFERIDTLFFLRTSRRGTEPMSRSLILTLSFTNEEEWWKPRPFKRSVLFRGKLCHIWNEF